MATMITSLLLLGAASAQTLTTSIWVYDSQAPIDKIGYLGSVVGVSGPMTTIAAVYDNGTDTEGFRGFADTQTFTVGPNTFEYVQTRNVSVNTRATQSDARILRYGCTRTGTATDVKPACTFSWGAGIARELVCVAGDQPTPYLRTRIQTFTYSGRLSYSGGVTTVTSVQSFSAATTLKDPEWCSDSTALPPEGGASDKITFGVGVIGNFQMVLTAGVEKLSATPAASGSASGATPTGARSSGTAAQNTAAAVPMKTAGPLLAGLGAAAAVFL